MDLENREAYLGIGREGKTEQLVRMQINSNKYLPVFEDGISDFSGIIYHPTSNKPLGVHLDPDYPQESFFDEGDGFATYFLDLKKAFEGYSIRFTSFSSDGALGVLKVSGDRLPGDYFLEDMTTKKVDFLISSSEWLDPKQLNPMQADAFSTEDGFRIGTYLTFPRGDKILCRWWSYRAEAHTPVITGSIIKTLKYYLKPDTWCYRSTFAVLPAMEITSMTLTASSGVEKFRAISSTR